MKLQMIYDMYCVEHTQRFNDETLAELPIVFLEIKWITIRRDDVLKHLRKPATKTKKFLKGFNEWYAEKTTGEDYPLILDCLNYDPRTEEEVRISVKSIEKSLTDPLPLDETTTQGRIQLHDRAIRQCLDAVKVLQHEDKVFLTELSYTKLKSREQATTPQPTDQQAELTHHYAQDDIAKYVAKWMRSNPNHTGNANKYAERAVKVFTVTAKKKPSEARNLASRIRHFHNPNNDITPFDESAYEDFLETWQAHYHTDTP